MVLPGSETTHRSVAASRSSTAASEMLGALDELLSLAVGLLAERAHRDLAAARARLAEDRFNLVVLGEFKRGKSTLINALLDRDVLPTGVLPLTSVVTAIGAGDRDRVIVHYADGHEHAGPVAELAKYVTEAANPGNRLGVELVRVELDHELLRGGLELVDTPGIGSIHTHNTEIARDFLPRVDAALCVLDAGQPLSQGEHELFLDAAVRVPRLLVVINKIDHLDPADREQAVQFVSSGLRDLPGDSGVEPFVVSARKREGLAPLRARLRALAADERGALLCRSVAALATSMAADTAQAARFESRAIDLPLAELASRARMFEERIAELKAASAEAGELLDRAIERAIEQSVNEPLREHARREEPRLRAALRRHVEELPKSSPRELSAELDGWIQATVRSDFEQLAPRFETTIIEQLIGFERRYAARVQRILEQVPAVAEDVFGSYAGDLMPNLGPPAPSQFSFKLKDVEHALDMIVGFGRMSAPGALGRRLVVRDADQRLIEMTDRHAGRLRAELVDRVSSAARAYRRELAAAVDEAIEAIRSAIERATADRRWGEQHTRARLDHLAQIERRCEQLSVQLGLRIDEPPTATVAERG
jgi:ribosome biogenesis GTPase A